LEAVVSFAVHGKEHVEAGFLSAGNAKASIVALATGQPRDAVWATKYDDRV